MIIGDAGDAWVLPAAVAAATGVCCVIERLFEDEGRSSGDANESDDATSIVVDLGGEDMINGDGVALV